MVGFQGIENVGLQENDVQCWPPCQPTHCHDAAALEDPIELAQLTVSPIQEHLSKTV